ncbi:MAG TPA: serine protease, partial [Methylomirabilota bacterium]|nr:serine protease [Methylomirabilota bacterium]
MGFFNTLSLYTIRPQTEKVVSPVSSSYQQVALYNNCEVIRGMMVMTGSFAASIVRLFTLGDKKVNVVGTGFLVGTKYVVTCAHVIAQALNIDEETRERPSEKTVHLDFPKSSSQKRFTAHVICWYPPQPSFHLSVTSIKDIAILELDEIAPRDALATRFAAPKTDDRSGHQFYTYGFPYGYNQSVSATGQLRATELNGWMQLEVTTTTSIPIEPGFSGAPVWDKDDGGVVG